MPERNYIGDNSLPSGEETLMYALYEKLILDGYTSGMFREKFMQGADEKKWSADDAFGLEKRSLIEVSEELILAGIFCLDLTEKGERYMEGALIN